MVLLLSGVTSTLAFEAGRRAESQRAKTSKQ